MNAKIEAKARHRFTAAAERVYDAWLDPQMVRGWMSAALQTFGLAGDIRRIDIDARVGGKFFFSDMRDGTEARHWGTYLELDRPRRIVFTWIVDESEESNPSRVTLTLEPDAGGCVATIVQEMDAAWTEYLARTEAGWTRMLQQVDLLLRPAVLESLDVEERMPTGRLEAFSDGVFAIIITIMVLELKAPQSADPAALAHLLPEFLSYVLSFIYVGIYWNNHHHVFHAVQHVKGMVLWANLHLLFWLSLVPFVTRWIGSTDFALWPVVAYGIVLIMCAAAWEIMRRALLRHHGPETALARALSRNYKEGMSLALYAVAIALAFVSTWAAFALYWLVAVIWFVPDTRIEHVMESTKE